MSEKGFEKGLNALTNSKQLNALCLNNFSIKKAVLEVFQKEEFKNELPPMALKLAALFGFIDYNTSLIELTLRQCGITSLGAAELARNRFIKKLDLEMNYKIGDDGAAAFINNSSLTELNLSQTGITGIGLSILALNPGIRSLTLWEDDTEQLWTRSAVHFLWANKSLLSCLCGTVPADFGHLSLSDTSRLKKIGPRNRLFQKQYAIHTKAEINGCLLEIKGLAELVYDYVKGEYPYDYAFFNTGPAARKMVNNLCKEMPELRKRFDFLS